MPQAMKIPDAKAAVRKEWEKVEKLPAWQLTKVKSKRGGHSKAQKKENNSPLLLWWTLVISRNAELEP